MKVTQLAWLMLVVGLVGAGLLAASLYSWSGLDHGLLALPEKLIGFLSLLFLGAFLASLWQAWFAIFAGWTGRVLPVADRAAAGRGVFFGVLGFVGLVVMVYVVVWAAANSSDSLTTIAISLTLGLQAVLLICESRWIADFSRRSAAAELQSP